MALEFPSWLEWLEWLVGADWPHGNEDRMWQMGKDLEALAGDVDNLLDDLDQLISDINSKYPEGVGGDAMFSWLTPLRDGKGGDPKNGSLKSLADNYRSLAKAADSMGDELESAKLNFYIAGAWLIAELVWASMAGPFAPALHGTIFGMARVAFRQLGIRFGSRIASLLGREIGEEVFERFMAKVVYEVLQEAAVETVQGTSQELLVQFIQNQNGHVDGYDWGKVGINAGISAIAGAGGGLVGAGAGKFLPTDMGGWKGAFNGALTGALAGAGGAGAAWLGQGAITGNWDFDPRSLTGGAFSGAGPSAIYGAGGESDYAGPMGNVDGATPSPQGGPESDSESESDSTGQDDSTGDDTTGGDSPSNNGQDGGPSLRPSSGTTPETSSQNSAPPAESERETQSANGGGGGIQSNRQNAAPDADVDGDGQSESSSRSSNSGSPSSTTSSDISEGPSSRSDDRSESAAGDGGSRDSSSDGSSKAQDSSTSSDPSSPAADTNTAVGDTNSSGGPNGNPSTSGTGPVGAPMGTAPAAGTTPGAPAAPTAAPSSTATLGQPTSSPTSPTSSPVQPTSSTNPAQPGTSPTTAQSTPAAGGTTPNSTAADPKATGPSQTGAPDGGLSFSSGPQQSPIGTPDTGIASVPSDPNTVPGPVSPVQAAPTGTPAPGPDTDSTSEQQSTPTPDATPIVGIAPVLPSPTGTDPTRGGTRRDRGNARDVGDFRGDARPQNQPSLTQDPESDQPDFLQNAIDGNLQLITPADVRYNRDTHQFILPNGRTVTVKVGPVSDGTVAEFTSRPGGYDVHVSPRARNEDLVRAVAHELAELRLMQDLLVRVDPDADRPSQMTTNLGGRFAEVRVLTSQIDQAAFDPARAKTLPRLRHDLDDLLHQLGFNDPDHANTVKRLLAEHDPTLAHRLELEQRGLLDLRPSPNPDTDGRDYDAKADAHLDRLQQQLRGDFVDDLVRAERRALDGRLREELARRVFDPLFEGPEAKAARRTVDNDAMLDALDPVNQAINDPNLTGPERVAAVRSAIDQFWNSMPDAFRDALGPDALTRMQDAANGLDDGRNRISGVIDHTTGELTVDGDTTTLSDFLHEVDRANRAATANGLDIEYTVVVHDPVDGRSSVEILSRPRPQHRLPLAQNVFGPDNEAIAHQPRPAVPAAARGGHTIDVGVGRSAFAVEMTPDADKSGGGLIIKTELASDKVVGAQRRRILGINDPGPLTQPGTVMVFGDLLGNGHILGDVARIYINNVSAKLPAEAYAAIAAELARTLAPGGRIELQWDMKPEEEGGERGDRGHIDGETLWQAIQDLYGNRPVPFRIAEHTEFPPPGNTDYDYSIDAANTNNPNAARMAEIIPPLPEYRMVIVHEPPVQASPQEIESVHGIPVENQRKIQDFADRNDLIIDVRPTNPDAVQPLRDGAMPKPMSIKDKTISAEDVELGAHPKNKGLVGRFPPGALSLPDTASLPPEGQKKLEERLTARERDYAKYLAKMNELVINGEFRLRRDGVLEGRVGDEWKPVTGDHDLFNIRHADGSPLSPEELARVERELAELDAGIQHGPHVYWDPEEQYQRTHNFEKIINSHQLDLDPNSDNEPLVHFRPNEEPVVMWADRSLRDIDREMTPWHVGADLDRVATPDNEADIARLRELADELGAHPDFDHAGYRQWVDNADPEQPPTPPGSPEHQLATIRREVRAGTDPADILSTLDNLRNARDPEPDTTDSNNLPEHGTASPVGEFRGDARPEDSADLTRDEVLDRLENNLGLLTPEAMRWNDGTNQFELTLDDGRTLTITVDVGPTTDNAVADFTARTDDSGRITGYDVNVSPRARDQDVVRALAHELAEISLAQNPEVLTDPVDDRPSRLTSHLGGRYAEMRVLIAQIDDIVASRDRQRALELPGLRLDLNDLIEQVGLRDPQHAPTAERILSQYDSDLARRVEQLRMPVEGVLRPGAFDPDAQPTPHDLGRIRQLRSLAEQSAQLSPEARETEHDGLRREALALVERLGLREATPGANARRGIIAERLTDQARRQVDDLLADVGRPDFALPDADREFVEQVRLEDRAANAVDFLSQTFHIGVLKAHQAFRTQAAAHNTTDNIVQDADSGARWHSWPPNMEPAPPTPVADIGLPVDPEQLHERWSSLTDAEKDALYREDPYLGNRDGIPHVDRDHYNRLTLAALREQAQREYDEARLNEDGDRLKQAEARLSQIDDMRKFLDSTQEGLPPHLLSYLDEKLQYIYALGDPDKADNVAIALAGAFRRRSGVGYAVQTLQQLRQTALAIDPTKETSTLLFGAYNNPDSLVATISSRGAEDGAQKVREFHEGLRVTNQGERVNITTIAHSYGGVTGGHAAGHGHALDTDALVFIGSWGTGVDSVADLRLTCVDPADTHAHVFATMADHDSIRLMPPTHGPAPDDPAFGATVFESDTTASPTRLGWNPDDHLAPNYFSSSHPSYRSLGLILTGHGHLLSRSDVGDQNADTSNPTAPDPNSPERGTASPVGEFRGDARPEGTPDLTRDDVLGHIENNLGLLTSEDVTWHDDTNEFTLRRDGNTITVTVNVGPTTNNAVADFTSRTDDSGHKTYDVNVSPRARDQDIVRALAHELAEITLAQDPNVLTDPDDDRPSRLTSHLGGRYAEMRVLHAQIDDIIISRDKVRLKQLPLLRSDLHDLMEQVGLHDPDYAPTAERLLSRYDADLARRIDQERLPDESVLRPGDTDPDAQPTPHDLGRIKQLRSLAERLEQLAPQARQSDPEARAEYDALRREALALVERLGVREDTPGAHTRRDLIADRLTGPARARVDELLADVGRRDTELPDSDREFVDQVRLEAKAAAALDFLSPLHTFHIGVLKAYQKFRKQIADYVARGGDPARIETGNLVEDPESGARWFSWPPDMEMSTENPPVPDIGLPTDPRALREHWSRLTDDEKDALHRADPYLGSRDGIPQVDRDHYNRLTLADLREQAQREQNEERLKQIDDMLSLLDSTQEGLPPHLLSYLDEKLRYVYALGDPDAADNVAIALAGAFRRRSGVGYAVQTLQQLRQAALAIDPTKETSVLLFGAYDNPDSLVAGISSQRAEEGAQKVREFHEGLRVTNQGERVNITTIAHSYGGVTGGHAAGHGHALDTDALVFIGALGAGVPSVDELRLTGVDPADLRDHVFATMAEYDSVLLMPPTQGPTPTDPAFGATVFESDSTPSRTRLGWNPDDHLATNYFGSHTRSYRSLGLIIAGYRHLLR
ncbi:hypothetical protein [Nocardia sp. NPDC050406]|uniref:WXG100-like domain-containing protein n=1 Tax=Nocardia sp. NPDC050406 TaxID=3364318 RepID=UPI003790ABD9